MDLRRALDVAVCGQQRRITDRHTDRLVHGLIEGDVRIDHSAEIDHPENKQQKERRDDGELDHRLRALIAHALADTLWHFRSRR